MNNILVTGGSGFIGSSIVKMLIEKNYAVTVLDDMSRGSMRRLRGLENNFKLVDGDIREKKTVLKALENIDSVFHLAYINGTQNFYDYPEKVLDVAVRGMQNLVECAELTELDSFFLASSSEVYQEPPMFPTPELIPMVVPNVFNPRYSYGLGKIYQEFMTVHCLKNVRRKIIFRPHNIYGPDMGFQHVIPELFTRLLNLKGQDFQIKGNGEQLRTFCEISDFIDGIEALMTLDVECEIFNIGSTYEISIYQLAQEIIAVLGLDIDIQKSEAPMGETMKRLPDISKISSLGYSPKIDITTGLIRYKSWFESEGKNL